MRVSTYFVGMIAVLVLTHCFADSASAQSLSSPRSDNGSESRTRGSSSTSSSISFAKDGKKVDIKENGSGLTITVDGKSVRARNVDELRQKYPDAYRLYDEKPGFAIGSAGGSASASGSGSSSSMKSGSPGSLETQSSKSKDRSVTVIDNGKKVTIFENNSGITVKVGEKSIRAKNAKELKKKSARAFKLYEKHLKNADTRRNGTDAERLLRRNVAERPTASDLLREKLEEMKNQKSGDPRFRDLIQRMLREMDNQ